MMIDQTQLISFAFPLVGGSAIGFGVGYVIKKLETGVHRAWAGNAGTAILTHLANKIATVTQHMNHVVPVGMGLLGFAPGVLVGFYKG